MALEDSFDLMGTLVEWVDELPDSDRTKCEKVMDELRTRPNTWAKIEHVTGILFSVWWDPISRNPEYEVVSRCPTSARGIGAPRDFYARYIGEGDES